jgi:hypothetical protein
MLISRIALVGLAAACAAMLLACGGGDEDEGPSCGSANQCVSASNSSTGYTIRNACSGAITVRLCEQYAGATCSPNSGFQSTFGGGQTRNYSSVRSGLVTVTYCAY